MKYDHKTDLGKITSTGLISTTYYDWGIETVLQVPPPPLPLRTSCCLLDLKYIA
jgi:hypothetical protein